MPDPSILLSDARFFRFRALEDVELRLEPLTVLIGENNAGKSAVLRGLDVALGAPPQEDDFFIAVDGSRSADFQIDIRFIPWNGSEFPDSVSDVVGIQMLGLTGPVQHFAWRVNGSLSPSGAGVELARRYLTAWPAGPSDEGPKLKRQDFALVSYFLLDALRDFSGDQRSGRSFWGRLLSDIEIGAALTAEIEAELRALGDKVVGSSEILAAAQSDLAGISSTLGSSVKSVGIEPLPARVVEVARAVDVVVAARNGHALPMRMQGQGTRSVAAVLAFHAFTKLKLGKGGDAQPSLVSAFEEPEAHLHPQAQRAMFGLIEELPGQRIVSSHSPLVTGYAKLEQIVALRQTGEGVRCFQASAKDLSPPNLSAADRNTVERVMLMPHSECLFARLVILVEGDTEEAAIPVFGAVVFGCELSSAGITVVNAHGAGNMQHIVSLLEVLHVPFLILVDGDKAGRQGIDSVNKKIGGALMPDEVVMLPDCHDFDSFLLACGYIEEIKSSIAEQNGDMSLKHWGAARNGGERRDGSIRNYSGPAQEVELVLDYCRDNKGQYGAPAARAIVAQMAPSLDRDATCRALPAPLDRLFVTAIRRAWGVL